MKIYVSSPSNRLPDWEMQTMLHQAIFYALMHGYSVEYSPPGNGASNIAFTRNKELARFLKSGADLLFITDDDVGIPRNTLVKLAMHNLDIVGGVVRKKQRQCIICADTDDHSREPLKTKGLIEVRRIGTGCTMVKREVVEKMIPAFPELHYEIEGGEVIYGLFMDYIKDRKFVGCDYAFSDRARQVGAKIWLDHGILCHHWGRMDFCFVEGVDDGKS